MSRNDKGKGRARRSRSPEGGGFRGNFPNRSDRREESRPRQSADQRDRVESSRSALDILRGIGANQAPELQWIFHQETGLLIHETNCDACIEYASHWAESHRTRDPTLMEGIARSRALSKRDQRDWDELTAEIRRETRRNSDLEDRIQELTNRNRQLSDQVERLVREASRRDAYPNAMDVDQTPGAGPSDSSIQVHIPESEHYAAIPEATLSETNLSSPTSTTGLLKRKTPEASGKQAKRPRDEVYVKYDNGAVLPIPRGTHGNASLPGGAWRAMLDNAVGTTDRNRVDYASTHRWDSAHNLKLWKDAVAECRSLGQAIGVDQRQLLYLSRTIAPGLRDEARLNPGKTPKNIRWVGDEPNEADLVVWGFIRTVIGKCTQQEKTLRRDLLYGTILDETLWDTNDPTEQSAGWTPCALNSPASTLNRPLVYNHLRVRCNVTGSDVVHRLRPYVLQGSLPTTTPQRSPLELSGEPSAAAVNSTTMTNPRQWGQSSTAPPPTERHGGTIEVPRIHIPNTAPATLADSIHAPAMDVDSVAPNSRPALQPYSPTVPEGSAITVESGPPSSVATSTSNLVSHHAPEASGQSPPPVDTALDEGDGGILSEPESYYEYPKGTRFMSPGGTLDLVVTGSDSEDEKEKKKSKSARRTDKRNRQRYGAE